MLRALWTKINLATTVSVTKLEASSTQQYLQAVVNANAFQPFQFLDDSFSVVDTLSLNYGLARLDEVTVSNDAATVSASLGVSDALSVGYDLLDNLSSIFQMGISDELSFEDNLVLVVGYASVFSDFLGLSDVCLQFLSSGSSGSVFNESVLNSSTFNA